MTTHSYHPDTHTHGLADDCERCREHAEAPWTSLDRQNISRLLNGGAITRTDRMAAAKLREAVNAVRSFRDDIDSGAV